MDRNFQQNLKQQRTCETSTINYQNIVCHRYKDIKNNTQICLKMNRFSQEEKHTRYVCIICLFILNKHIITHKINKLLL